MNFLLKAEVDGEEHRHMQQLSKFSCFWKGDS